MGTRLYHHLPTPAVSPAFQSRWTVKGTTRRTMDTLVGSPGATTTNNVNGTLTGGQSIMSLQYVAPAALPNGPIEGTFDTVINAKQSSGGADLNLAVVISVWSADGLTLRGVLLDTTGPTECSSTVDQTTRTIVGAALTPVVAVAGDILAFEYGGQRFTAASASAGMLIGQDDRAADPEYALADGLTYATGRTWAQFSQNLYTARPGSRAVVPHVTSLDLSWAAVSGATGYDVRINGGAVTDAGTGLGYTFAGLTPSTTYTLEVRARTATGPTAWGPATGTTLAPPPPPDAPTGLAVTATTTTLGLSWVASPGAIGYDVRIDGGTTTDVGAALGYDFTGLEAYTTHTLEVRAYSVYGFSGWVAITGTTLSLEAAPYTASVRLELGPESDPIDVTGTARAITARRGLSADASGVASALEPGTLIATVFGAGVSPQDNPHARPGRPIRLYARDGETWVRVWTGTLDRARLDFRARDDFDAPERVVIFEATDVVTDLAALPALSAIGGTFRQRVAHVLAGTGIPYAVTDTGTDDPTPPALPTDATTVLGQLVLARDTTHAVMHVDGAGVLQLYADRDRPSTHATVLFSDDLADAAPGVAFYTHLEPQFDTADLLNVLEVTTVGVETPATYVDTESRDEWGPSAAAVTVNEGDPEDHAVRYLAGRTTPTLAVKRVQFNVTDRTGDAALVEVNDAVRIRHRDLGDSLAQVLDITHTITATRWTVSLTLRGLETLPIRWVDVPAGLTWDDLPAGFTWDDAVDWRP